MTMGHRLILVTAFLADRMRDGSDEEDESNRSPKTSDASKFPSRSKKPEPDWGKKETDW